MSHIIDYEPSCHGETTGEQVWKDAMIEEYRSILKNDVWDIVPRPEGKSVMTSKWIYKINHETDGSVQKYKVIFVARGLSQVEGVYYDETYAIDGSVEKYKAIFVARGLSQVEGVDYDETFSPVARYTSIHTIIALATSMCWKLHQMDVKTTFLNGEVEEEVYIERLEGFMIHNNKYHVCRLNKALYGLKKAPHAWYEKMDGFLMSLGFNKSVVDPNLYYHIVGDECLILILYVDELVLTKTYC
jgi:hypothetical protein